MILFPPLGGIFIKCLIFNFTLNMRTLFFQLKRIKKMKFYVCVLVLSNWIFLCIAQNTIVEKRKDSLNTILKLAKEDTNRVKALLLFGKIYQQNNFDSALFYYKKAQALSKKLNFTFGLVSSMSYQVSPLTYLNQLDDAIAIGTQALALALKSNEPNLIGAAYINLCNPYTNKGDYKKCIEYTVKAMKIYEGNSDSIKLTNVYINLGYYYKLLNENQTAYAYDLKGINLARMQKKNDYLEVSLLNLSIPLTDAKKYDSAILVLKEAQKISEEINDKVYESIIINNLIIVYRQMGQNEKTLPLVNDLITKATASGATEGLILGIDSKGDYFINKSQYDSAAYYYLQAIDLMKKNNNNKYLEVTYSGLTDAKAGEGAFHEYEIYRDLRDSVRNALHSEENLKTSKELEVKYQSEKKDQEIKIQKGNLANSRLWIGILSSLIASSILLFFIVRSSYKHKQKISAQEKELQQQKIIQLQNEKQLTATQSILKGQEEERGRLAKDLHDGLGGILSSAKYSFINMKQHFVLTEDNARAFEKSMSMLDQSISELRRVAHNMMPETLMKLNLNEALQDYCQQVTDSGALPISYQSFGMDDLVVDNTIKTTVYRIVQELTNNIIKHAAATKSLVQIIAKDNTLNITVEDDGKGFDVSSLRLASGIGYKNTQSRIEFLKGKIDIQSKHGEGTSVYIEIPL
jgi:signal transduction histidine kinase